MRRRDRDALVGVLYDLADRLGWSDTIDQLLTATPPSESLRIDYYSYPFDYGEVDDWADYLVTPELLEAHEADLVDFSSVVTMLAAMQWEPYENYYFGPLAYSLLHSATEIDSSCDLQLNLAYVVSLGMSPQPDDLGTETDRAAALCGDDDLTAPWLHAITENRHIHLTPTFAGESNFDPRERITRVESEYAALRSEAPESPLGWAGQADLDLRLADEVAGAGYAPFQARSWRRQALAMYEHARTLSGHPDLVVGQARALSALGRGEEAAALVTQVLRAAPDDLRYQVSAAQILIQAQRPGEAAGDRRQRRSRPALVGELGGGSPICSATALVPMAQVPDGSLNETGGADVGDTGFIPTSRPGPPQDWYCLNEVRVQALVLAGQAGEALELLRGGLTPSEVTPGVDCGSMTAEQWSEVDLDELTAVAAIAAGDDDARDEAIERRYQGPVDGTSLNEAYERTQDLFRAHSELDRAADVAKAWRHAVPSSWRAWHRSGEIAFLAKHFNDAVGYFDRAARLVDEQLADDADAVSPNEVDMGANDLPPLLDLDEGASYVGAGNEGRARAAFEG